MAGLSCGAKCAKAILFVFNAIFFLSGAALLGVGIWLMVDPNVSQYIQIASDPELFKAAAILLICVGAFIFIVGFFGCCGAIKESSCMLCLYIILLVLIFIVEIAAGILAAVYRNQVSSALLDELTKQAKTEVKPIYGEKADNQTGINLGWQRMQLEFTCCGGSNYSDYKENPYFKDSLTERVPKTCCKLSNDDPLDPMPENYGQCVAEFNSESPNPTQLYNIGCRDGLFQWIDNRAIILVGIGIGIAFIQILGIIFACCVRREIANNPKYNA